MLFFDHKMALFEQFWADFRAKWAHLFEVEGSPNLIEASRKKCSQVPRTSDLGTGETQTAFAFLQAARCSNCRSYAFGSAVAGPHQRPRMPSRNFSRSSGVMCSQRSSIRLRQ